MPTFEDGVKALDSFRTAYTTDVLVRGTLSEADTRVKVIDRLLTDVLGWSEAAFTREEHVESGYIDYVLRGPHPLLVIEAKKRDVHFRCPLERANRSYVTDTLLRSGDDLADAIRQARRYADDKGIEYACVTNGAQWVIFQAIGRGKPWTQGRSIVFRSLDDLADNFVEFWNLFSAEAVTTGAIPETLQTQALTRTTFSRALHAVAYADAPLERNPFAPELQALITAVFQDLGDGREPDLLRKCYVWEQDSRSLERTFQDTTSSALPAFAQKAGFRALVLGGNSSGAVDTAFQDAVKTGRYGSTILLLGKIGSGKTTLLQRLLNITAPDDIRARSAIIYAPFTDAPPDPQGVDAFVRRKVMIELKSRHNDLNWDSGQMLRAIYAADLKRLREGVWETLTETAISEREALFLEQRTGEPAHADRILEFLRTMGIPVVLVIDNMDHHSPSQQEQVFLHAHSLSKRFDALVLVALREETFFRGIQSGVFNAYSNVRFQVTAPDVRKMISLRLRYILKGINTGTEDLRRLTKSHLSFHLKELRDFLEQAARCLQPGDRGNPAIAQFLDNVSQGNMRLALDMFGQYLVSGATKVPWIVDIIRRQGRYNVAEHEFIKAVMLGDHQFYKDSRSAICNLFEVSSSNAASNLTSCRLLTYLNARSGVAHVEGPGFVSIDECMSVFGDLFGSTDDVTFHCERLLRRKLLEADTRSPDSLIGVRAIRSTRAGIYYLKTLTGRFQYLDLVALDTPIWNNTIRQELLKRVDANELEERIERAELLVGYLRLEEERSLQAVSKVVATDRFGQSIVDDIAAHYDRDVNGRLAKNARLSSRRIAEAQARARDILKRA